MVSHIEGPEPEATYFSKAKQNLKTGHIKVETTQCVPRSLLALRCQCFAPVLYSAHAKALCSIRI